MVTPPFRLLVVSLTSLALRCRLGEEESIPLLWVTSSLSASYQANGRFWDQSGRSTDEFSESESECLLCSIPDVQIIKLSTKRQAAFGQKQPFEKGEKLGYCSKRPSSNYHHVWVVGGVCGPAKAVADWIH